MNYKKILLSAGILLGAMLIVGCGAKKTTTTTVPLPATTQTPASGTATQNNAGQNNSSETSPDSNTPATSQDVDKDLKQIDSDLNAINSADLNPNDLNSAELQK
ncbi:MAG: hypothetical protein NTZ97_03920 [Candidatus Moranbacteria bacterium]|nr:hypothetical protein [Candidatus Moranbacteria bacterium]